MQTTRNILKVYRSATPAQIESGMEWYRSAQNLAFVMGRGDIWRGAALLAAYSPLTPWDRNVALAISTAQNLVARTDCLPNNAAMAQKVLDGVPVHEAIKGQKVNAFMTTIATAGVCDVVTIDVHAYSIAMGKRIPSSKMKSISKSEYATLSQSYRNAAKRAGISPSEMQAITWVAWRER